MPNSHSVLPTFDRRSVRASAERRAAPEQESDMGVTPSTRTQIRPRVTDSRLSAPAAPAGPTDPVEAAGFDPSEHNVKDVREYVEANPDEAELVLAAEAGGKDRASLVAWLNDFLDSRADSTDDEG